MCLLYHIWARVGEGFVYLRTTIKFAEVCNTPDRVFLIKKEKGSTVANVISVHVKHGDMTDSGAELISLL